MLPKSFQNKFQLRVKQLGNEINDVLDHLGATSLSRLKEFSVNFLNNIESSVNDWKQKLEQAKLQRKKTQNAHLKIDHHLQNLGLPAAPQMQNSTPSTPIWQKVTSKTKNSHPEMSAPQSLKQDQTLVKFPKYPELGECLDKKLEFHPYLKEKKIIQAVAGEFAEDIMSKKEEVAGIYRTLDSVNERLQLPDMSIVAIGLMIESALNDCQIGGTALKEIANPVKPSN